eukprot:3064070-Rhodomonas_salina.1
MRRVTLCVRRVTADVRRVTLEERRVNLDAQRRDKQRHGPGRTIRYVSTGHPASVDSPYAMPVPDTA